MKEDVDFALLRYLERGVLSLSVPAVSSLFPVLLLFIELTVKSA